MLVKGVADENDVLRVSLTLVLGVLVGTPTPESVRVRKRETVIAQVGRDP
jgi:hypothetical protein